MDIDLTLCDHHAAYILFIRSLIEAQHDEKELSEKDMIKLLKVEGRAIGYPKTSPTRLTLLQGGKDEEQALTRRSSTGAPKRRKGG